MSVTLPDSGIVLPFIGGRYVEPRSGKYLDNFEPATGASYGKIADCSADDVNQAVVAAANAGSVWGKSSIEFRSRVMHRIADLIESHCEQLASAESRDGGKPISIARNIEIPRSSQNFRFFANLIAGTAADCHDGAGGLNFTMRSPWGIGGAISPWNLPLYLFTWKIAPALAAGNCLVAKPSELTPVTAMMLGEICNEAGMPAGVLNIVQGAGLTCGSAIVTHPSVRAISFTGGTQTGGAIAAMAAPKFKRLSLELGGKNPNIIFEDCDFDRMIETTLRSSFQNSGQICLCGSRILVQRSLRDRFMETFVQSVKCFRPGDPREDSTVMGAVVSQQHQQKILSAIQQAERDGGAVVCGGKAAIVPGRCEKGWFVEPTVITGNDSQCPINQEEVFGPVVTVQFFDDVDEAIRIANGTNYGLSATVWTSNIHRAMKVAREVEAGVVWINGWLVRDLRTPFGGMKQSGVGREGGWDAVDFWTQTKNVCLCE